MNREVNKAQTIDILRVSEPNFHEVNFGRTAENAVAKELPSEACVCLDC